MTNSATSTRTAAMIEELNTLANSVTMYQRFACDFIENLSDVNYSVLKRAWRKADIKGNLSLAKFTRSLLNSKLNKTAIV